MQEQGSSALKVGASEERNVGGQNRPAVWWITARQGQSRGGEKQIKAFIFSEIAIARGLERKMPYNVAKTWGGF
jgi:hypothetical protein